MHVGYVRLTAAPFTVAPQKLFILLSNYHFITSRLEHVDMLSFLYYNT